VGVKYRGPRVTAALGATLILAACGATRPASRPPTTTPTSVVATPGSGGRVPVVEAERSARYGAVLVTPRGQVLYHLAGETAGSVGTLTCTGPCTADWVPLVLPRADLVPVAAPWLARRLGLISRPDGSRQVTYDGQPLYTRAPGRRRAAAGPWSVVTVRDVPGASG